jgi:hypothetical protein
MSELKNNETTITTTLNDSIIAKQIEKLILTKSKSVDERANKKQDILVNDFTFNKNAYDEIFKQTSSYLDTVLSAYKDTIKDTLLKYK